VTPEEVRRRVDKITAEAGDDEVAHSDEDELHHDVLRHIAATAPDPWRTLAAVALETEHIDFARWYA